MTDKKRWRHTRRLNVKDHGPHEPEPYARVSDDGSNRCVACGDYIVEVKDEAPSIKLKAGELEELYEAAGANEAEMEVLDRLAERAGLIWICPVRPWNNLPGEPCGDCGLTEEVARAGADRALASIRDRVGEGRRS